MRLEAKIGKWQREKKKDISTIENIHNNEYKVDTWRFL